MNTGRINAARGTVDRLREQLEAIERDYGLRIPGFRWEELGDIESTLISLARLQAAAEARADAGRRAS